MLAENSQPTHAQKLSPKTYKVHFFILKRHIFYENTYINRNLSVNNLGGTKNYFPFKKPYIITAKLTVIFSKLSLVDLVGFRWKLQSSGSHNWFRETLGFREKIQRFRVLKFKNKFILEKYGLLIFKKISQVKKISNFVYRSNIKSNFQRILEKKKQKFIG